MLALSSVEFDLTPVQVGQQVTTMWRGKPIFVRRRTPKEIADAKAVQVASLPDPLARNANKPDDAPATDEDRTIKPEWLIMIGICTHLGCIPTRPPGRFRRLSLPVPRLAVRHGGTHPPRACAGEHVHSAVRLPRPTKIKIG